MSSYLTQPEADAIAATLPATLLANYLAASDANKATALELASYRFDTACRFQGRKYDPSQERESPRVAYESGGVSSWPASVLATSVLADTIWDWDEEENAAVVPGDVLRAVLFEANSILAGERDRVAEAIQSGLASQSVGGMSESYRPPTNASGEPVLCRDADLVAKKYRLRSGRIE